MTLDAVIEQWRCIGVGTSSTCLSGFPAVVKRPLLPWQVGEAFADVDTRIVFVGKPHRGGDQDQGRPGEFLDWTRMASSDLRHRSWAYWSYTIEIADRIHGEGRGWERIAMTNVVKCTNVGKDDEFVDTTSPEMIRRCVTDLGRGAPSWPRRHVHPYRPLPFVARACSSRRHRLGVTDPRAVWGKDSADVGAKGRCLVEAAAPAGDWPPDDYESFGLRSARHQLDPRDFGALMANAPVADFWWYEADRRDSSRHHGNRRVR